MKLRIAVGLIVLIILATAGLVFYAWHSKPELVEIYPPAGAENVSATTPIKLVFSRPMQHDSVSEKLAIDPDIAGTFSWDQNTLIFTPEHPWPGGKQVSLRLNGGARAASWLSLPMAKESWSFNTSQESLIYLWPSDGPADLYELDIATGEKQQYTHGMGVLDYSASSNGMMIYFSASNFQAGADLYSLDRTTIAVSEGNLLATDELLNCGLAQCRNPVVSFDGRFLAYEYISLSTGGDTGSAQIWLLNLATSESTLVGESSHDTVQPSWSTTGWLAYYDRSSQAYVFVKPASQEKVELPNLTGQPGTWSQDGEDYLAPEITYLQETGGTETGTSHLMLYNLQGNPSRDNSGPYTVEDVDASYSPDGSLIAFARKYLNIDQWTFGRQLWVMNADGSDQHPITDEPDYNHYDLNWSRNGGQLAYVRFNQAKLSDPPELWMINNDGSGAFLLVVGGYSPVWMP